MSASVLETFLILFETDAADVKDGVDKAKKSTKDLQKELNATDQMTNKVGADFSRMAGSAAAALAAVISLGAIVTGVVATAQASDRLGKLADSIDENVESIDAWGQAVKRSGGDVSGFEGSLVSLTEKLQDLKIKGENEMSPVLRMIGVDARNMAGQIKQPLPLLLELASAFEKMSKADSKGLGAKLGLDTGTIMLLQQGRRAVEDLVARQKMLGVTTKEAAEIAAKFNMQLDDTGQVFRSLFIGIGSMVLPMLTAFLKQVEKGVIYLRDHKDAVIGFFIGVAAAITAFFLPAMIKAAIAVAAATWPFLLIVGAITAMGVAFALVYEDIMAFRAGHASLIGDIFEKWPAVKILAQSIGAAITWVFDSLSALWTLIGELFTNPTKASQNFFDRLDEAQQKFLSALPELQAAADSIQGIFTTLGDGITSVWRAVWEVVSTIIQQVAAAYATIFDKVSSVKGWFGFGKDDATGQAMDAGNQQINTASQAAIGGQTSNSITNAARTDNKSTSVKIDKVEVNTQASDPNAVSAAISGGLAQQMQQALAGLDDGVAA
jgi:hypothetical protein